MATTTIQEREQRQLRFVTLDVFTKIPFQGNPLAIVRVPAGFEISQEKKQLVAKEFNLSETVFLHEGEEGGDGETKIDIFMTTEELPFAGHPTIGSGWHLLTGEGEAAAGKTGTTLVTKAGKIPVRAVIKNGLVEKVGLSVPVDFKVHTPYAHPTLKKNQGELRDGDYLNGVEGKEAVASIVKGMTFILLALKSTEALGRMGGYTYRTTVPGLGEWDGMVGVYAFVILGEGEGVDGVDGVIYVQTRMFVGPLEDPATGSAASTLAGWLGIMKGKGKWAVEIVQGMEMGRRSEIGVVVDMGDEGGIRSIELVGSAVQVMEGYVYV